LMPIAAVPLLAQMQCPNNYQVMGDGRCIRAVYVNVEGKLGDLMSKGINECKKDGAVLPIIRTEEENTMFNAIFSSFPPVDHYSLGALCNSTTRRLEWMDGSKITFNKSITSLDFDCVANDQRVMSRPDKNDWDLHSAAQSSRWSVICVVETKVEPCGDYDQISDDSDETKPCFKIFNSPMSWKDAEKK
ncbi:hypothetical protein PFISCL1PPCAC_17661, partial [Pristionchus fissidentatus]